MAVTGGIKCLKYLIFVFNGFFWLAGTAVIAIGLWLRLDPKTKGLFEGSDSPYVFYTGVYILIGAGALMMVVGFLGCCGAIQESPTMLGLFFFFLLIIFAIEVAAGIWGFSNQSKVVNDITTFYLQTYNNFKTTGDERLREILRVIQNGMNCCGPTGTVVDIAKDTCPRGEPLEELIAKVQLSSMCVYIECHHSLEIVPDTCHYFTTSFCRLISSASLRYYGNSGLLRAVCSHAACYMRHTTSHVQM
uniref:CD9 molecule a n=1 Tax=Scophthalmus maximus TaxID=52904 RepID=A0A8D2ZKV1_SCOMX